MHSWWECRLVQPLWESSMEFPQEIKNVITFRLSRYTSGNISENIQNTNSKEHKHPYVHCSEQNSEEAQVSTISI